MRSERLRFRCGTVRPVLGFSLFELVISIAILAILMAIAVPAYSSHVRRSARTEVQALMTTAATRQTQFLVDRRRYADSLTVLNLSLPASLQDKYTVTVTAVDGPPPAFSITATAKGTQVKDACPSLVLDQAGDRTPSTCW